MITKPRKQKVFVKVYCQSSGGITLLIMTCLKLNFAELVIDSINLKIIITTISKETSVI